MKKSFAALFVFTVLTVAAFAADYKFPGWQCKDAAQFTASAAIATNPMQKCRDLVLAAMIQNKTATFDQFCALVDSTVEANKGTADAKTVARIKLTLKKQIPLWRELWLPETWKFCLANPNRLDLYFVLFRRAKIGMSDTEAYSRLVSFAFETSDIKTATRLIDSIIRLAPKADADTVKADLQRLNRQWSPNLLVNKTQWEPVITKIRTLLETY